MFVSSDSFDPKQSPWVHPPLQPQPPSVKPRLIGTSTSLSPSLTLFNLISLNFFVSYKLGDWYFWRIYELTWWRIFCERNDATKKKKKCHQLESSFNQFLVLETLFTWLHFTLIEVLMCMYIYIDNSIVGRQDLNPARLCWKYQEVPIYITGPMPR